MDSADAFNELIDPEFNADGLSWEAKVGMAATLIENKEVYQKALGKLAASIPRGTTKKGDGKLGEFAMAIENLTGRKTSPNSLRVYRRVYERLVGVIEKIPADWPYRAWRVLADSESPLAYLEQAIKEGWSGSELVFEVHEREGKHKVRKCPACGIEL